jgi:hypothetical protein
LLVVVHERQRAAVLPAVVGSECDDEELWKSFKDRALIAWSRISQQQAEREALDFPSLGKEDITCFGFAGRTFPVRHNVKQDPQASR